MSRFEYTTVFVSVDFDGDWGTIYYPDSDECEEYNFDTFGEEDFEDEDYEDDEENFWEEDDNSDEDDVNTFKDNNQTYTNNGVTIPLEWEAPEYIEFIIDGSSKNDIQQGRIGDCWFLSALSALATRKELIEFVINKDVNYHADPEDGYSFTFFKMGKWCTHHVDKELPQICAIAEDNEHWVPYTEKAYAKKYKTYSAINGGYGCWALTDLTGGIAIRTTLEWSGSTTTDLFTHLIRKQKEMLITCCTHKGDESLGLPGMHEYSILQLATVMSNGTTIRLVNVRNPHGNDSQGEFDGVWSDDSSMWDTIDPEDKEKLLTKAHDGAFWMTYRNWVKHFNEFSFCYLPTDFSEAKGGPSFAHESAVTGVYSNDCYTIQVKMTVDRKQNIYIQTLLDSSIADRNMMILVNFQDSDRNFISPRYPVNYSPTNMGNYIQNGYHLNLGDGEYMITTICHHMTESEARDGMKWLIKVVAKGVHLEIYDVLA